MSRSNQNLGPHGRAQGPEEIRPACGGSRQATRRLVGDPRAPLVHTPVPSRPAASGPPAHTHRVPAACRAESGTRRGRGVTSAADLCAPTTPVARCFAPVSVLIFRWLLVLACCLSPAERGEVLRRSGMRIQCGACEAAAATVVCCADEAALCARCDVEIHAANKLASKHQRLPLGNGGDAAPPAALPRCDVCQEKPAFIFCVEDRALFCRDCDEPIHVPGTLSGNHQRYLATGIRVGFSSVCGATAEGLPPPPPPKGSSKPAAVGAPAAGATKTTVKDALPQEVPSSPFLPPSGWAVEDLLQLSDYESSDKKDSPLGFKELEWFADIDLFHAHSPAKTTTAEVPEFFATPQPASNAGFYKTNGARLNKKPRIAVPEDDEDYFIVPDLG